MERIIEKIYEIDHTILLFIQENMRFTILTPIMNVSSMLVNLGLIWVLTCIVLLFFKKTRLLGAMGLSSLLLCLLINNVIIKHTIARSRPFDTYSDLLPLISKKPKDYSFASGHTTASFAAAGIFVRFIPRPLAVLTVVYAFLVAFSRLYLGVHYPTDVLCGMAIGIIGSTIIYYIYSKKFDLKEYSNNFKVRQKKNST